MTDKIDAATCRCCGRTALFDGVKLIKVSKRAGMDRWQCQAPCEMNKKKKEIKVRCNNRVMIREVWANSLLERLSSQLSTRTTTLEQMGDHNKKSCPDHYAYDIVIPLAHARNDEPLGWTLFGAKYTHDEAALEDLRTHVAAELPDHRFTISLVDLVVDSYCYGLKLSGRSLRRMLDLTRGAESAYHTAMQGILSNLHAVEENYARAVKRYL